MKKFLSFLFIMSFATGLYSQKLTPPQSEDNLRLQIYLDEKNFGPGKIDGLQGKFTEQALKYYKEANPEMSEQDIKQHLKNISPLFSKYKITENDKKFIGKLPEKPKEQAKKEKMPYTSHAELVAERFHVDPEFLAKINPEKDMENLQPGDVLTVPNVEPFRIEKIKKGKKPDQKEKFSNRRIKINTSDQMLKLYEDNKLLAVFPITPGSESQPAPKGTWELESITYLPPYRYDKKMLKEGKRSKDSYSLPDGPNSPVGVVWMGLNKKGIGMHGTDEPETIGRSASHGCIRLSNWDAITLSKMISPGIKVVID